MASAKYLLDTNVISEMRKPKPHGAVMQWFASIDPTELRICALSLGEIQAGVEITRAQNSSKADQIEAWLVRVAASYEVLAHDAACCRMLAKLMHGASNTLIEDAMIAATARVHGLIVVTRNVSDFAGFAVPLLNPFEVSG